MTRLVVHLFFIFLLTGCTLKPGTGSESGSDIVKPLWEETNNGSSLLDSTRCSNVVALLIGIGQYDPAKGWEPIQAQNDVAVMIECLRKQGIPTSNIHTLIDQQATRTGIIQALSNLADTLRPGTKLIVLYGGHARQLPDDNNDEADGYDEAIVPFDAPSVNQAMPDGYLRDDELDQYFSQIRTKIGPAGSLWLIFDSCHSQTLNRGQTNHQRGGVPPLGSSARSRKTKPTHQANVSGWRESTTLRSTLAPFIVFGATTDGADSFETTDASGKSLGPLTRAIAESWRNVSSNETYQAFFHRVAVSMAEFAPYQQPTIEGDVDRVLPGCQNAPLANTFFRTKGETLRINWPDADTDLNQFLSALPFVQQAAIHPDLRIARRGRGYNLTLAATNQLVTTSPLSVDDCVERIREYFARKVLLTLQQTSPEFQIKASLQRLSIRTENGKTIVTDTLSKANESAIPSFTISASERLLLTLTNVGPQACYITVVDLLPDGRLHVLLPEEGRLPTDYKLLPGQSLQKRIRLTEPLGAEVYKLLLTPEPIDLRSVLQTRGNQSTHHPYESIFQRIYSTRGQTTLSSAILSTQSGATADVAFWVKTDNQ